MKILHRFDSNGFYVEDVLIGDNETTPTDCTEQPLPQPNYKPQWNGSEWIETKTDFLPDAKANKINDLRSGYSQTLLSGFNVTVGSTTYVLGCSTDDKTNLNATQTAVDRGYQTFPIYYADIHGNPIVLNSQTDLDNIEQEASKFLFAQHQQIMDLVSQTQNATDVNTVNLIQWTPAVY